MMSGAYAFEDVEFVENPEPRCPCVLLLDTSSSMRGEKISHLNDGLRTFQTALNDDSLAARRVEVAIVTFDSEIKVVQDFITADSFMPPMLTAQGTTHMGGGIQKALDMIQYRKQMYKDNGVMYYRPWVFLITDGEPQGETDEVVEAAAWRIREEDRAKRLAFFAVGVEGANMTRLAAISPPDRTPVRLNGLNFHKMFVWLSTSMQRISNSRLGDQIALPPPTGWGSV
jgi:uncharacterized protein YegL